MCTLAVYLFLVSCLQPYLLPCLVSRPFGICHPIGFFQHLQSPKTCRRPSSSGTSSVGRYSISCICSSSLSGKRALRRLISRAGWLPNIFLNVRSALGSKYFIIVAFLLTKIQFILVSSKRIHNYLILSYWYTIQNSSSFRYLALCR